MLQEGHQRPTSKTRFFHGRWQNFLVQIVCGFVPRAFGRTDRNGCSGYSIACPCLAVLFGASLVFLSSGCVPQKEKSVVLYSASDREYASPILDAFDRSQTGTEVVRQFDVEASKTLGLVTRIEREKERPRCDVFWNNEIIHTIRLQKQGLLAKRSWKIPDSWPKEFKATDGTWVGFASRARVLLINKEKLPDPKTWPKSVLELASPNWHQKCGMAYPLYGSTATHMSVLASHAPEIPCDVEAWKTDSILDWNRWSAELLQHTVVLAGNKQVAVSVGTGELSWGLTDTDDAVIEKESGKPVEIIFPDQAEGEFGTLFIPNTLAVLNRAPNPVAASLLADYLISEKTESRLAMGSSAQFPIWPGAKERSRLEEGATIRWARVDFERAADRWPSLMEELKTSFDKK